MKQNRRGFFKSLGLTAGGMAMTNNLQNAEKSGNELFFKISLAEWSFHKALWDKKMDHLDFPVKAKNEFDIHGVEYVSTFFKSTEKVYLDELLKRSSDNGVTNVLIMIDAEGNLGDADEGKRMESVNRHHRWVDAAKYLGCHSIRVNARGKGTAEEVAKAAINGLSKLTEYGASQGINVIVENHGEYSSNGQWLSGVIKAVNSPYCGTLPDVKNFRISATEMYDYYKGITELMPYAKGVSAKTNAFDADGNERDIDYARVLKIVKDAGYRGFIGIEYEGTELTEEEGVRATKKLLERIGSQM